MNQHDAPKPVPCSRAIIPVANFRPICRERAQFPMLRSSDTHYGIPSPNGSELTDVSGPEG